MLNSVEKSTILDHSLNSGHSSSKNYFKILDSCQLFDIRISESYNIHKIKPSLNDHASSVELCIINLLVYVCNLVYYFHLKSFIAFHIFFFLIKIFFLVLVSFLIGCCFHTTTVRIMKCISLKNVDS